MSTLDSIQAFLGATHRWRALQGERLEAYQQTRARQLMQWVVKHSGFYRQHWRGHNLADWRRLPEVNKALMMANFAGFNTEGIDAQDALGMALRAEQERHFSPTLNGARTDNLTVGLSSGTSGHRGMFLVSPLEQASWAGVVLARALPRLRASGERIAFFLRSNSNLYEQVGRGRWLQFRYFDLMTPIVQAVAQLNEFQPTILVAPPSMLELLAQGLESGALKIKPNPLFSVAEVLEAQDQARLEGVFQSPVRQIYQATEGLLAISCKHQRLHLQEDVVAVQLEPIEGSERATPIITDLWRRTQPIVRYRLNDVLWPDPERCPCGSDWRVIAQIEGRQDDLLEFFDADGHIRPFFPDTIRRAILLSSPEVREYQALQHHPGELLVRLEVSAGAEPEVEASVRQQLLEMTTHHGCQPAKLTLEFGIPAREPRSKRRRVQRIR